MLLFSVSPYSHFYSGKYPITCIASFNSLTTSFLKYGVKATPINYVSLDFNCCYLRKVFVLLAVCFEQHLTLGTLGSLFNFDSFMCYDFSPRSASPLLS